MTSRKPNRPTNRGSSSTKALLHLLLAPLLLAACDLSDPAPRLEPLPDTTRARLARECTAEFQDLIASVDTVLKQIDPDPRYFSGRIWGPVEPSYPLLKGLLDGDSNVLIARGADSSVELTLLSAKRDPLFRALYIPSPGIDSLLDRSLDALARYRAGTSVSPRAVIESRFDESDSSTPGKQVYRHETIDLDGDGRIVFPYNRRTKIGMVRSTSHRLGARKVRMIHGPGRDGFFDQIDDNRWFRLEECSLSGTNSLWTCSDLAVEDTVQGLASYGPMDGRLTWTVVHGADTLSVARLSYAAGVPYLHSFQGSLGFGGSRHPIRLAPWTDSLRRLLIEDPSDTIEVRLGSPDIRLRFTSIAQVVRRRVLPASATWSSTTFEWTPDVPGEAVYSTTQWRFVATRTDALGRSERIRGRAKGDETGRKSIQVTIDDFVGR